jgi:CheY-like chemotaxis protein
METAFKATVLVVDDTAFNLTMMNGLLGDDYKVKVANDGEKALRIARADSPPDLILLDIMMPGMDGYEVCRQLKSDPATRDIPVIFLTAKSEAEDERIGLELGAVDYISKPVVPPVVVARIRTHLALRQARAQLEQINLTLQQEKEIVENIVSKMHSTAPFDSRHVRFHLTSVDRTAGDMVLSAYRPDGIQHVMVGDFSGHGLSAAVAGPLVSYIFYQLTTAGHELRVILAEINRTLERQLPLQIFMAACAVEITADRTQATFWNCGLPPTLIMRRGIVLQRIAATGMPLGIADPIVIAPSAVGVNLEADDFIYIFSDGMTEVRSVAGEEFGQVRLEALLATATQSPRPLSFVWDALIAHHGNECFPDDATLMEVSAAPDAHLPGPESAGHSAGVAS